jgi:hypothetical protein
VISGTTDLVLLRDAANTLACRNGTSACSIRAYNTYTDASNNEYGSLTWNSNVFQIGTTKNGTGTLRATKVLGSFIQFNTNGTDTWFFDTSGNLVTNTDNTYDIGASGATRPRSAYLGAAAITAGSATGLTVNSSGDVRDLDYKVTLATTAFVCNATTCDVTIGTLPADTMLVNVYAKLTTTFACTATCTTSTLSMILGKGAGGAEYLASFDADAATGVFGDADAELGTLMTRAAAIQGGTYNTTSQAVVLRLTSGTGVIGNGSATNLSQGSVSITLTTRVKS